MKVLLVSSEAVPFAKTGGLGDVAGSLPQALKAKGIDVRVMIPQYKSIPIKLKQNISHVKHFYVHVGWRRQYCGINETEYDGIKYYFVDNEYYFARDTMYGCYDDGERFSFFTRAVLEAMPRIGFMPDVIHCNDWQTGMIPALLKMQYASKRGYENIKTVFTIHNLMYQGIFPKETEFELLGIDPNYFTPDKLEFYGNSNFLKAGVVYADYINTVSPTYSEEIKHPYFGEKLDGLLRARGNRLMGILNGLDYNVYNPENDRMIFVGLKEPLTRQEWKKENKRRLQNLLGLPERDVPVIGMVTRLVSSKGIDLVQCVLNEILEQDVQLVILGTGEGQYEWMFREAMSRYPGKVSANITFDNVLSHRIYAGSDMFLMPSRFEPCGLGQIIALRYGSIPIVRETGGLKDTVTPYDIGTGQGNGFTFCDYNAHDMLYTIKRAVNLYNDKEEWKQLTENAMDSDFSWEKSAEDYIGLYKKVAL